MEMTHISTEYTIENLQISEKTIKSWFELFNQCFEHRLDRDINWALWYNASSYKHNNIYVIKHLDKLVTAYSLFPITIMYNGNANKSYLVNNNMTHPSYVNRGLFTKIGSYIMNNIRTVDITLLGIPNDNAINGHRKVGWQELPSIPFFETTNLYIKDRIKDKFVLVDRFMPDDNTTLDYFSAKYDFYIKKDCDYLNWRFIDRPSVQYQIYKSKSFNSYVVLKYFNHDTSNKLHIVDYGYNDITDFIELIQLSISIAAEQNVSLLNLWCSNIHEQCILQNNGFHINGFNRLILHSDINFLDTDTTNWHITLGDNDVF